MVDVLCISHREADKLDAGAVTVVSGIIIGQEIPAADVKEMETALRAAGKTAEFVLYPGAPHAFYADYRPSYRPEAAKDAWGRCVAWFDKYLGK